MSTAIALAVTDGVARVTLNRPEVHNAFDDALIAELTRTLEAVAADRDAHVLELRGTGKSFCAGADLNWMQRMADYDHAQNLADAQRLAHMLHLLYALPKPTVAVVQGPSYGGGVGLVACCDIALAGPRAAFSLSEIKLGLIPATISPFVAEAIGARATRKLSLTGERIDAHEAQRLGLVHELLADDDALGARAHELSALLAGYGPQTLAEVKALIGAIAARPIDQTLHADTARRIADARCAPEGREGVAAFLAKRKPVWPR
jgi:methylglutaconyl-CoA hydratase